MDRTLRAAAITTAVINLTSLKSFQLPPRWVAAATLAHLIDLAGIVGAALPSTYRSSPTFSALTVMAAAQAQRASPDSLSRPCALARSNPNLRRLRRCLSRPGCYPPGRTRLNCERHPHMRDPRAKRCRVELARLSSGGAKACGLRRDASRAKGQTCYATVAVWAGGLLALAPSQCRVAVNIRSLMPRSARYAAWLAATGAASGHAELRAFLLRSAWPYADTRCT